MLLASLLNSIIEGPTFTAAELPTLTDDERQPPSDEEQSQQTEFERNAVKGERPLRSNKRLEDFLNFGTALSMPMQS